MATIKIETLTFEHEVDYGEWPRDRFEEPKHFLVMRFGGWEISRKRLENEIWDEAEILRMGAEWLTELLFGGEQK